MLATKTKLKFAKGREIKTIKAFVNLFSGTIFFAKKIANKLRVKEIRTIPKFKFPNKDTRNAAKKSQGANSKCFDSKIVATKTAKAKFIGTMVTWIKTSETSSKKRAIDSISEMNNIN